MAHLILPSRFNRQPQGPVEINQSLPFANKWQFLHNFSVPNFDYAKNNKNIAYQNDGYVSAVTYDGISYKGDGTRFAIINNGLSVAANEPFTMFVRFIHGTTVKGGLINCRDNSNSTPIIATSVGYNGVTANNFEPMSLIRDNANSLAYTTLGQNALINDAKVHTWAVRRANGRIQFSLDGNAWGDFGSGPTNAQGAITIPVGSTAFSYHKDPSNSSVGISDYYIILGGFVSADISGFVRDLHTNPWQIFRKRSQILYFDVGGGAGATDLVIADATHGHTADNTVLTSSHLLTVADATHAHSADNISLSTAILLAISEALHGHSADNLALTLSGSENLVIADAAHAHTADNLSLTALSVLVVAEALHSHLADNVVLSLAGSENLVIADAAHAHSADNLSLTSQLALSIAEAAHAHTADGVVITSQHVLAVADALHAHAADNLTLSDAPSLNIAEASHGHSADNLALTSASLLAIADAAHAHLADNVELTSAHMLAIIEAMHAHAADNVVLSLIAVRAVELLTAAARDTQLTAAARDTTLESRHAVHG